MAPPPTWLQLLPACIFPWPWWPPVDSAKTRQRMTGSLLRVQPPPPLLTCPWPERCHVACTKTLVQGYVSSIPQEKRMRWGLVITEVVLFLPLHIFLLAQFVSFPLHLQIKWLLQEKSSVSIIWLLRAPPPNTHSHPPYPSGLVLGFPEGARITYHTSSRTNRDMCSHSYMTHTWRETQTRTADTPLNPQG